MSYAPESCVPGRTSASMVRFLRVSESCDIQFAGSQFRLMGEGKEAEEQVITFLVVELRERALWIGMFNVRNTSDAMSHLCLSVLGSEDESSEKFAKVTVKHKRILSVKKKNSKRYAETKQLIQAEWIAIELKHFESQQIFYFPPFTPWFENISTPFFRSRHCLRTAVSLALQVQFGCSSLLLLPFKPFVRQDFVCGSDNLLFSPLKALEHLLHHTKIVLGCLSLLSTCSH